MQHTSPKISLVTVCFNSAATIEDTIKSVACQTCPDIEYIVVDGLSTDTTLEIVRRYDGVVTTLISERDKGLYDAMNKGIAHATGDIIGLINSDDVLADENVLAAVARAFVDNPGVDACYGDLCYVKSDDLTQTVRYWRSNPYRRGLIKKGWVPPHPTLYVRREVYERCGGFDLTYRIAADFELMMRFFEVHDIRSVYIPKVMVKMRLGGTTNRSLRNIFLQNMEIRRALKGRGISAPLPVYFFYKLQSRLMQFLRRPE